MCSHLSIDISVNVTMVTSGNYLPIPITNISISYCNFAVYRTNFNGIVQLKCLVVTIKLQVLLFR